MFPQYPESLIGNGNTDVILFSEKGLYVLFPFRFIAVIFITPPPGIASRALVSIW
jgi:hypothetical protein